MGIAEPAQWNVNRHRLIIVFLFLLPTAVYSTVISTRYGFRDDYSILREANEEAGKVTNFCAGQGRPIYGIVLEKFFAALDGINDLWLGRSATILFLGGLSALIYVGLLRLRWPPLESAFFSALVTLLPSNQVFVSWAICWPIMAGAVLGIAGFLAAEGGGIFRRILGVFLVAMGALIYQPNALMYAVLIAAGLVGYRHQPMGRRVRWLAVHLVVLASALFLAFVIINILFDAMIFKKIAWLVRFEEDPLGKIAWFANYPLLNALALFALNDMRNGIPLTFLISNTLVTGVILLGGFGEFRRGGWREFLFWAVTLTGLLATAYVVNLIAYQRYSSYRTILPLTAVCMVFFVLGLYHLSFWFRRWGNQFVPIVLILLFAISAPFAGWQTYSLFALPQQQELAMMEEGVERVVLKSKTDFFVIKSRFDDSPAPLIFGDEFGSLSTDADWSAKEILKLLLRERYPELRDLYKRCSFTCGRKIPKGKKYHVVIDMRKIEDFSSEN